MKRFFAVLIAALFLCSVVFAQADNGKAKPGAKTKVAKSDKHPVKHAMHKGKMKGHAKGKMKHHAKGKMKGHAKGKMKHHAKGKAMGAKPKVEPKGGAEK